MKFAIAVLACALAVANAQYSNFGFNNQYRQGQYNQGQYNRYQPNYNRFNYQTPKPYVSSTPFPKPAKAVASVSITPQVVVPKAVAVQPVQVAVAKSVADARSAETVKSGFDINGDGSYNYFYETNNGIAAQEQGTPRNFGGNPPVVPDVAQGSFSWISPEGRVISVTYVADENGYQPQSDAIPVPPELPPQIARALEYTAKYHSQK